MSDFKYYKVLSIAGSDSGGGAGIQADIKTISACGCYAATAITAITVQNTMGVQDVHAVPTHIIKAQIEAVLDDIGADAVKIGMLYTPEVVKTVASVLGRYKIKNIVLDPVMVATSGDSLLQNEAIQTLIHDLLPLARLITPNIPEAERLLGKKISSYQQMLDNVKLLSMHAGVSVFLKGGHLEENSLTDIFYNAENNTVIELNSEKINSLNTHGTGCTLSSALAAFLAKGFALDEAVQEAKNYIHQAIVAGADYKIGNGHGPVRHFFKYWE